MDSIQLNFNPTSLMILNIILGFILFGVALDLKLSDFKRVFKLPKEIAVGLFGQILLLPILTVILILVFKPTASLALGMLLVASCPGGNLSNFMTAHANGNAALSVTLTTLATLIAIVSTPFNFYFWGSLIPSTKNFIENINVPVWQLMLNIFLLIGIPLVLGLLISHKKPRWSEILRKPMKIFSLVFFGVFVLLALQNNWAYFLEYIHIVFFLVLVHNAVAFAGGYGLASLFKVKGANRKAITLEVGLQNSGLGLILIFSYFNELGGMAIITAFWGIWHIISGLALSTFFKQQTAND